MNLPILISDLETMLELFLCCCYDPQEDKWYRFEISKRKNQVDALVNYIESHEEYWFVYYNGLRFDSQVLEFILRNYQNWIDKTSLEICAIISQIATDVIDDSNYDVFPRYRENQLSFKIIDPFEIAHYSNRNRMVSLKRLMFEMDMENIEEMPIHHLKKDLTEEECQLTIDYCDNDVKALYEFYKILIGETDHPLYKGNNQIELREDIETEFEIPCLNYSNSKIGDEIIKKFYCEETGIKYTDLPKKGTFRKSIALRNCIPKYVKFQTKQLQNFLKELKVVVLNQSQDYLNTISFYGQKYTFAKGGLHNVISGKIYENDEEYDIIDVDVSGYYPATIINNSYFPAHLGKAFLVGYSKVYFKRIDLKPLAKKDKKIKGIVSGLKEAGNCPYGKSSEITSWLYDKQMTLATCITGELSLLMLIEDCELEGIKCIMANTDGASFIVPKKKKKIFDIIKENWKQETSIKLTYELEEVYFKTLIFSTVNDYLGIKIDGELKGKGDLMKDFELHKNKSARIVPLALEQYFVNNVPIEDTIKNHTNIYDFCIRQKASRDFHYEGINKSTGEKSIYNKLIRYYVSNEGEKVYKIKNPSCTTNAPPRSQVEAGNWACFVCNKLKKDHPTINVNFDYYINRTQKIIDKVEGRRHIEKINNNQLNLFQ